MKLFKNLFTPLRILQRSRSRKFFKNSWTRTRCPGLSRTKACLHCNGTFRIPCHICKGEGKVVDEEGTLYYCGFCEGGFVHCPMCVFRIVDED